MKLRILNAYSTGTLITLSIALACIVVWGLQSLQASYRLMQDYQTLKTGVQVDIRQTLDEYLLTGDTTRLLDAERSLQQLMDEDLARLPTEIAEQVAPQARDLMAILTGDLRAAGKLSGNPMALLIQNETEFRRGLDSLAEYAANGLLGNKRAEAIDYLALLGELGRATHALTMARERFGEEPTAALKDNLLQQLEHNQVLLGRLQSLPTLGQYREQEVDEMASLLWGESSEVSQREEIGQLVIGELSSLAQRYPAEIARTSRGQEQASAARELLRHQLQGLQQVVADSEQGVTAHRERIFLRVGVALGIALLILVTVALLLFWLQQSVARGIESVASYLASLAEGDYRSLLTVQSRVSEMVSLTSSANLLRNSVSEILQGLGRQQRALMGASESVSDSASEVNRINTEQLHDTRQVTLEIEGVADASAEIARSTESVSSVADHAGAMIIDGSDKVVDAVANIEALCGEIEQTEQALQRLKGDADRIGNFVAVIQGIAEQTNLLALNAAIEAARAGEQGRGFAVVADEVRNLAGKTNEATQEIQALIGGVLESSVSVSGAMHQQQQTMQRTSTAVQEAGELYTALVARIEEVRSSMLQISSQAQTQSEGAHRVRSFVQTASHNAETACERSGELLQVSSALASISGQFEKTTDAFLLS